MIGSRSLNTVRNGLSHRPSAFHAARLGATAGSPREIGTSLGKARAPAVEFGAANGASYARRSRLESVFRQPAFTMRLTGRIGLYVANARQARNAIALGSGGRVCPSTVG